MLCQKRVGECTHGQIDDDVDITTPNKRFLTRPGQPQHCFCHRGIVATIPASSCHDAWLGIGRVTRSRVDKQRASLAATRRAGQAAPAMVLSASELRARAANLQREQDVRSERARARASRERQAEERVRQKKAALEDAKRRIREEQLLAEAQVCVWARVWVQMTCGGNVLAGAGSVSPRRTAPHA